MVTIRSDRFPPSESLSEFRVALRGCLTEQTIGIRGKRDRRMRVTTVLCMVVYRWFNAMHFSQMAWNYSSSGVLRVPSTLWPDGHDGMPCRRTMGRPSTRNPFTARRPMTQCLFRGRRAVAPHPFAAPSYGYTPRTSLAAATRSMPFMSAAVRMSTFFLMLTTSTSSKARIMISLSRLTISFSDQK